MNGYVHRITVVTTGQVLERLSDEEARGAPSMLFCDAEGLCYFDEAPNPYLAALVDILDEYGAEGWTLVQVVPRERDMICFWRRKR